MYYLRARLFPAVLTCLPFLVIINKVLLVSYSEALKSINDLLPLLTNLGLSAAVIFGFVMLNRLAAKEIFQKLYFKEEANMPTTTHLLWSDKYYDSEVKNMIRTKIKEKFLIDLPGDQEEKKDESATRKKIATAVSLVRSQLRSNDLILQHNIEYGFFRNLAGGSALAVVASVTLLIITAWQQNSPLIQLSILMIVIYMVPILSSRYFMNRLGDYYSKILYEQFLAS